MLCKGSFRSKVRGKRLGIKAGEQFQQNWVSNQFMHAVASSSIESLILVDSILFCFGEDWHANTSSHGSINCCGFGHFVWCCFEAGHFGAIERSEAWWLPFHFMALWMESFHCGSFYFRLSGRSVGILWWCFSCMNFLWNSEAFKSCTWLSEFGLIKALTKDKLKSSPVAHLLSLNEDSKRTDMAEVPCLAVLSCVESFEIRLTSQTLGASERDSHCCFLFFSQKHPQVTKVNCHTESIKSANKIIILHGIVCLEYSRTKHPKKIDTNSSKNIFYSAMRTRNWAKWTLVPRSWRSWTGPVGLLAWKVWWRRVLWVRWKRFAHVGFLPVCFLFIGWVCLFVVHF